MSFASLLAQMKKGKSSSPPESTDKTSSVKSKSASSTKSNASSTSSQPQTSSKHYQQTITQPKYDPAVARLKAARHAEREAAAAALSKQKSGTTSPRKAVNAKTTTTRHSSHSNEILRQEQLQAQIKADRQQSKQAPKRLSYKELMQQAKKVDSTQMAITIKAKTSSPEPSRVLKGTSDLKRRSVSPAKIERKPIHPAAPDHRTQPLRQPASRRPVDRPLPVQQRRRRPQPEDDGDLSDFVVSEDEGMDYHAEIANMFGRKRQYQEYDDYSDDDDMEATGADILQEENRSSRVARMEEEREAEIERRKKAEKAKRLKR